MKKRLISIALALVLCLSLMPTAALAETGSTTTNSESGGTPVVTSTTPTDITETGLKLGRDADHPLPTTETVYKAGEGTVTYQPATESANAKLILDNATINGIPDSSEVDGYAIELALPKNTKLDVEVKGTNTLNSCLVVRAFENNDWYSPKPVDVTIQPAEGESNATLNVTHPCSQGTVDISGKLTIQGNIRVNVKNPPPCYGNSYAFWARSDMAIQNGAVVTAEGNNSTVFFVDGALSIDNATVTATNNGNGDAFQAHTQLAASNNATVTAICNGSGRAVYIIGSQMSDKPTMDHALKIENGATLNATTQSGEAVHIGDERTALVDNGTMNLVGGSSWFGWSKLTVKTSGKVTLAEGSEMQITCDEYNGGGLTNNGTFVNNGTLKFTGNAAPKANAIGGMNLSGSGMVQLGEDGESETTYYTNDGTPMKNAAALDLRTADDSNDLATNGYSLDTSADGDAKTLKLGSNVHLGTLTLPTDAEVTIVLSGNAYIDTITGGGSLTVETAQSVTAATLMVSRGTTLGGNLHVGGKATLFAAGKSDRGNLYADVPGITFTGSGSTVSIGATAKLIARGADTLAISGTVTLPEDYYWRAAPNGTFTRKMHGACDLSKEQYVELSTGKPAGYAVKQVNYLDWDDSKKQMEQKSCEAPTVLTSSEGRKELNSGWYVVEDDVTIGGELFIPAGADVHLILCDGKTLTVGEIRSAGSNYNKDHLTIYAQSEAAGTRGKLTVGSETTRGGVFGFRNLTLNGGTVTVHGGSVSMIERLTVNGGKLHTTGAGIAVWDGYGNGQGTGGITAAVLTVNGGEIEAKAKQNCTVDAPGNRGHSSGIEITTTVSSTINRDQAGMVVNGGKVTATGGAVYVAYSKSSGDASYSCGICLSDGSLTVNGGKVTATGGTVSNSNATTGESISAGIISNAFSSQVSVKGDATVTATGGSATGPKSSSYGIMLKKYDESSGELRVEGSATVNAAGGSAGQTGEVFDIKAEDAMSVSGGKVQKTASGGAVVVSGSSVSVTGGTMTLGEGSCAKTFAASSLEALNALVDTGCRYFEEWVEAETQKKKQLTDKDVEETGSPVLCSVKNEQDGGSIYVRKAGEGDRQPVDYLDAQGKTKTCVLYTLLESDESYETLGAGWYVVQGDVSIGGAGVSISHEVHLILCDGAALTVQGITTASGVEDADKLTIYGQSGGSGTLNIGRPADAKGYIAMQDGELTVNGGTVTVKNGSTVTIKKLGVNGGTMKLKESDFGSSVTVSNAVALKDLLAEGYAFWQEKDGVGSFIKLDELTKTLSAEGTRYSIKACTHSGTSGTCAYCEKNLDEKPSGGGYYVPRPSKPTQEKPAAPEFVDVGPEDWFYEAVRWAAENGITGGVDATHFGPNLSCTRAQLVTFLWRAAGKPVVNFAVNFNDLKADSYYTEAVRWAASLKIVDGFGNGKFGPEEAITREQMATILFRFAKAQGVDVSVGEDTNILSYADALELSDFAFEAVQWAVGAGVVQGAGGNLMPKDECTRAQIVTMLHRLLAK